MNKIQHIEKELFGSYWKPTPGKQHTLDIVGSHVEYTNFGDDAKEKKPVVVLKIIKVDNQVFQEPIEFTTGAYSFVNDFAPINNDWSKAGVTKIRIMLKYGSDKKYTVMDLTETLVDPKVVEEAING